VVSAITPSPMTLPTAVAPQTSGVSDSGANVIADMAGGVLDEFLDSLGIDFGSLGSSFWRGAALALAAFLAVGALALVRYIFVALYNLIRR